jgi:membrane protease YdiL (CAAX protease family)
MQNLPSKRLILAQIFLIFILPVFLLYFHILPVGWRMPVLIVSALIIYGIITREKWTLKEMGIRLDDFKEAFPFYLGFTLVGIGILFLLKYQLAIPDTTTKIFLLRAWLLFIPVSIAQELAFRAFLIPRLQKIYKNPFLVIGINSILFTLIHIVYPNLGVGLPLAFVSGIFFAWLYIKYPNLTLISLSHSVLNLTAVLLGFFTIAR